MAEPESKMNLRRFDLNLLPILRALLATRSVARASEMLGLSQSATSGALSRLRLMFGDPLLILVGRQLLPTPYAEALVPLIETTFVDLHALLDRRMFDPAKEHRCFIISSADYAIADLGLPLIQLLAGTAPGVSTRVVEISLTHRAAMISGEIDFMISPFHTLDADTGEFNSAPLYEEDMVIVSSADFPVPKTGLDLDTYLAADHVSYGVSDSETFEHWSLARSGLKRRTVATLPHFNQLPRCVAGTGCLAMLPRHVAHFHAKAYRLRIWPVPFPIDKLAIAVHWSHVLDRNPAHRWFRDLIFQAWQVAVRPDPGAER